MPCSGRPAFLDRLIGTQTGGFSASEAGKKLAPRRIRCLPISDGKSDNALLACGGFYDKIITSDFL